MSSRYPVVTRLLIAYSQLLPTPLLLSSKEMCYTVAGRIGGASSDELINPLQWQKRYYMILVSSLLYFSNGEVPLQLLLNVDAIL